MKYILFLIVFTSVFILSGDVYCQRYLYRGPEITTHYTHNTPASSSPLLKWKKNTKAVYYELEVFNKKPKKLHDNTLSSEHIYYTNQLFTNACNISLESIGGKKAGTFYWRVRAMDFDHNPLTTFSSLETLYSDNHPSSINSPIPNVQFNQGNGTVLLYPVYQWIPNAGATKFEVEILSALPENPASVEPSKYRIGSGIVPFATEYYDPFPRIGTFYWRVRGLDQDNQPVGIYSNAEKFSNEPTDDYQVGVFGDSISHGGGHMSYSPADFEFSYTYYLKFPSINLSESGDTIERMVKRFDSDVLPFSPKYLIIMGASNSLRAGIPADKIITGLKMLQQKCYQNNIYPILLTLPPLNPYNTKKVFNEDTAVSWADNFNKVNAYIRTQIHIDTAADFPVPPAVLPTEYGLDGLHLDDEAKAIMGNAINRAWDKVLAQINKNSFDKITISDDELEMFYNTPDVYDL